MSSLFNLRQALADAIVAADLGWAAGDIILKRQTDVWNDVATAIATSATGTVLHLGIAEGAATEEAGLEMDLTMPVSIVCLPQVEAGTTPEEDLWEALVKFIHDLRLGENYAYRFRFKSFSESELSADGGTAWLVRQTVFTRKLSL